LWANTYSTHFLINNVLFVLLLVRLFQAASEATAVAAALSELEGLVSQLVGVGIYDMTVKEWRQRLRGKATVDELCELLPIAVGLCCLRLFACAEGCAEHLAPPDVSLCAAFHEPCSC
jgi:hypothetical protein